jgi:hypothetical protein
MAADGQALAYKINLSAERAVKQAVSRWLKGK